MGKSGKVWLVGAGPGDPGLLTVRGREVLSRAEVIFFDRLVNPGILLWANPESKCVDVGKTPRGKRVEQFEIGRRLVAEAKKGKRVVRLKGGDPFVFGRGGEEAEVLQKAGVIFEVVPGVTAGIAAPAMAGIPVTHRGRSTELTFKIGARAERSVRGKTWVGYMAVEGLEDFLEEAKAQGFTRNTPAALIERGTCRGQRVVTATLGQLAKKGKQRGIRPPAVVVVGSVVGLRKRLSWWEKRALAGKRVLLTGSERLGRGWREILEEAGAEVWELPMTQIVALKKKAVWQRKISEASWLVFTSAAGVRAFPGAVGDWRQVAGKRIAAVGSKTGEVLQSIGLKADLVGPGPGGLALAGCWPRGDRGTVLHLTGSEGDGSFVGALKKKGVRAERLVIYENRNGGRVVQPVLTALREEGVDWVILASGSAAVRLRNEVPRWKAGEPRVVGIGPATVRAARRAGWKKVIGANEVSAKGVLSAILKRK